MTNTWKIVLASLLSAVAVHFVLEKGISDARAAEATPAQTACQQWEVGYVSASFAGALPKVQSIPAGWEPFAMNSQFQYIHVRHCVK